MLLVVNHDHLGHHVDDCPKPHGQCANKQALCGMMEHELEGEREENIAEDGEEEDGEEEHNICDEDDCSYCVDAMELVGGVMD